MVGDKKGPHKIGLLFYYPVHSSIAIFFAHMLNTLLDNKKKRYWHRGRYLIVLNYYNTTTFPIQ